MIYAIIATFTIICIGAKIDEAIKRAKRKPRVRYSNGQFARKVIVKGMEKGAFYI
jgi:hypothetical protein